MQMRIGDLVARTGVNERLLRYYEAQGLLEPSRSPSGYREYQESDVAVVRNIRLLPAAGLTTAKIARMLPCLREDGESLVPVCPDLVRDLRGEHERIERQIAELRASQGILGTVIGAAVRTNAA